MYERKNRLDAYECEWFDSHEKGVSVGENRLTAMKLKIKIIIAEARSFAENIAVEMIAADAASFAMELAVEMIFAETKSFAENIIVEMTVADATSFNKVNSDPFSFWYEVWTEVSETDVTEVIEFDAEATSASETWNVSNAT